MCEISGTDIKQVSTKTDLYLQMLEIGKFEHFWWDVANPVLIEL